ncbi:hypothetical protein [Amycolatopsis sp. NPDC051372]|uniref:hypothetical protein n=1 Tax=unclassified Amycolatopsis TaxID=2618356 RepID=UPI00343DD62F
MTGQTEAGSRAQDRLGIPFGRPGHAREVAAAIAFLAICTAEYVPAHRSSSTASSR